LAYYPLSLLIPKMEPALEDRSTGLATAVRAVPSGWAPYAVEAAARGDLLWAVLPLLGLAGLALVLWQLWAVLLRRRLTTPPAPAEQVIDTGNRLLDRYVPQTPTGAVVVKELRTWWRDGRRRAVLLPMLLIGFALPVFLAIQNRNTGTIVFAGVFVAWLASLAAANQYGLDGTAIWQTLVTPGAAGADVRGRVVAWLLLVGPVATLATLVLPGALGRAQLYPWALSVLPVFLGVGAAAAIFLSAYTAYPLPQQRGNPFAATGFSGKRMLIQLTVGIGQFVVAMPVLVILGVGAALHNSLIEWAALPIGLATGVLAVWSGINLATTRLERYGPELLATVKPR
jgi:ABC-2 type transport system permease protein